MEATDRSISPLMITSVMMTATITFSIDSWNRLIWFWTVRKSGEASVFSTKRAMKTRSTNPSQLRRLFRVPAMLSGLPCGAGYRRGNGLRVLRCLPSRR